MSPSLIYHLHQRSCGGRHLQPRAIVRYVQQTLSMCAAVPCYQYDPIMMLRAVHSDC